MTPFPGLSPARTDYADQAVPDLSRCQHDLFGSRAPSCGVMGKPRKAEGGKPRDSLICVVAFCEWYNLEKMMRQEKTGYADQAVPWLPPWLPLASPGFPLASPSWLPPGFPVPWLPHVNPMRSFAAGSKICKPNRTTLIRMTPSSPRDSTEQISLF